MARIKKSDIFDPKLFTGTTQEIQTMIEAVKELKNQMLELMKASKEALKVKPTNSDGLKKQAEETQKVAQADKNLIVLEKERIRLQNKLDQQNKRQALDNQKLREQAIERRKALKQQAREELKLTTLYQKQSRTLNELRKKYKDLVLAGKGNTKQAKLLAKSITNLDTKLKNVDASVGQFQRNVGNYSSAFSKIGAGFNSLLAAGGITVGLTGLFRTIRNGVDVVKEFDQSNANLAAVLGKTTDTAGTWQSKVKELTEDAKRLGATTVFTAGQVAELQTEFARLGFSQQQIIAVTASTLDASAALQSDLADQAALTGAVLNAYGLEAEEAGRVNDVLAKSAASSALSFEKLQTALPTVAPVANAVGVSLERTTATLGTLVDRGIDASTAATGLRNVFLTLSKEGKSLDEALAEIRNANDQAAASFELFGKRGATIGVVLANTTQSVEALNIELENAGGTAEQMAKTQLDTLEGSIKLLQSAWQGLILDVSEAGSGFFSLTGIIRFLADNLRTIANVVKFATIAFVSYKATIIAFNAVTKIAAALQFALTLRTRLLTAANVAARIATIAFSGGLRGATRAMRLLNTSIKANPIGLLVSLLTTAIALLWDFGDAADNAAESQDRLREAVEKLRQAQANKYVEVDENTQKEIALIDRQIAQAKLRKASEEELSDLLEKKASLELKGLENKIKLGEEEIEQLQDYVDLANDSAKLEQVINRAVDEQFYGDMQGGIPAAFRDPNNLFYSNLDESTLSDPRFIEQELKNFRTITAFRLTSDQEVNKARLLQAKDELAQLQKQLELKKIENQTALLNLKIESQSKNQSENSNKQINIYQQERVKLLRQQLKISNELEQINLEAGIDKYNREADKLLDKARELAQDVDFVDPEGDGKLENIVIPDLNEYQNQLNLIQFNQDKIAKNEREFQAQVLRDSFDDYKVYLQSQVDADKLSAAEKELLLKSAQKKLNDELEILRKEYTKKVAKNEEENVKAFKDAQEEIKAIAEATNQQVIDDAAKAEEIRLAKISNTIQKTNALLDAFQQAQNERTQQQIKNIDEEIAASKRRFDELKQLSIQGNADAEKSALAEERRQQELEIKKQKVQRRQQLIEAGIAGFKILASKVEQGDKNPLASTITDITALTAFIQALPTFIEGTENVGKSLGKPDLQGTDGHIVRVDSAERIVDPLNNSKMSGISNDELGELAYQYKLKRFDGMKYNKVGKGTFEAIANNLTLSYQLSNQLADLNRSNNKIISAIEKIPHESWDYDKMSDAVIQKVKNQNRTEIRHYKNNSLF